MKISKGMKPVKYDIQMSRCSDDSFHLEISCDSSRTTLLRAYLSPEQVADLISTRNVSASGERSENLEFVGKQKVYERDQIVADGIIQKEAAQRIIQLKHHNDPEWTPEIYLDSRGSLMCSGSKTVINYSKYKYVEISE